MDIFEDTISAISTPLGEGGISVIRISGKDAITIADNIFVKTGKKTSVKELQSHTLHFGKIIDNDKILDEAVLSIFKSPHSYTGEDVIELSIHGGVYLARAVLELTIKKSARLARPGEFTERAFLNGKLDLSQAEAVADLINAKTEMAHKSSILQLEGELSKKINLLRDSFIEICSLLELELDFAEEDVEFAKREEIIQKINSAKSVIEKLIDSFSVGRIFREGVKLVIVGKPNVGKSSLLNTLLETDRAIVSHIPGTTRDVIEESININGILFSITDTAGLRESTDIIEKEGIERTKKQIEHSDLMLVLLDASENLSNEDNFILQNISLSKKSLIVLNKTDLGEKKEVVEKFPNSIKISAKEKIGIDKLKEEIIKTVISDNQVDTTEIIVTNVRHKDALERAYEDLSSALESIQNGMSSEYIALDIRGALDNLGEIVGKTTTDDILNEIFSKFCIGK